jgi:hypothetical protein
LRTQAYPLTTAITDNAAWPSWLKQTQAYPAPEPKPTAATVQGPPVEQKAIEMAKLRAQLDTQQQAIEELRRHGAVWPMVPQPLRQAVAPPPLSWMQIFLVCPHPRAPARVPATRRCSRDHHTCDRFHDPLA